MDCHQLYAAAGAVAGSGVHMAKAEKIGAVSIWQSMWILSLNDENCKLLNETKDEVSKNGGEAFVMSISVDGDSQKIIIEKFNAARDEEYGELPDDFCDEGYEFNDKA